MDLGLGGRAVVCTGAAGGIGRATAALLAAEGAHVLAVDRDDAAKSVADALPGGPHSALAIDLRAPDAADAVVAAARERLGAVHALVHLAATMVPRAYEDIDAEHWDLHQEVNVRGSFFLSRAAGAAMEPGAGGSIVLASSGAWLTGGRPDRMPYAASKGAVTTLARSLAKVLGPRGIRVNAVAPGLVDTPMMNAGVDAATRQALERETPLGRFAEPDEIARVIAFVASPAASFVSGAALAVTGGYVLH